MNRATKWYQTTRENKRPRRQCYQPLCVDEDADHATSEFDQNSDNALKLASVPSDHFVEKILEPGDTLLTLSFQFNCPVSELKRINHILRDNEIYARRKIKVPVKPGSIVTDKLAGVHVSNGLKSESYNSASSTDEEKENLLDAKSYINISKQYSHNSFNLKKYSEYEEIVNSKPGPSTATTSVLEENTLLYLDNVGVSSLQTKNPDQGITPNNESAPFKCNGADWGLSWIQLVICVLLLCFSGPLFYILYITEWKHKN